MKTLINYHCDDIKILKRQNLTFNFTHKKNNTDVNRIVRCMSRCVIPYALKLKLCI